ncbi:MULTISPECIES: DUF92 domain-containing protein [Paenibacillus]|uniref:DUF92 domain-containing protein n=1 Tax=Paenibacillus campinasensis TaxID=66347 RepID=A0ABW9SX41_9BACL|nr:MULTISPECIES: DUF92 domain-containing protein [Paenibacillus]MUG65575.1 DUF92 domain-containing protein [Paenibacillus campinasensis]PAK53873.1 hypothetical protein CHH75_08630 [Paenibacillus sp. 7541]
MDWLIGAAGAAAVAGAAYWKESLSKSGAIAALVMGTIYYGAGNMLWFGILLLFFITSTLLSRFRSARKADLEKSYAKTGRRDAGQVLANGGLGMLLCLIHYWSPGEVWIWLFIGVMAAVTADTWATEVGSLSRKPPRSILSGKVLPAGTSGGVSWLGSAAAALGGLIIGLGAYAFAAVAGMAPHLAAYSLAGLAGGLVGAFTDSYLGATVQLMYRCQVCRKEVEVPNHCGAATVRARGWSAMNNDAVNMISSLLGGAAAWAVGLLIAG